MLLNSLAPGGKQQKTPKIQKTRSVCNKQFSSTSMRVRFLAPRPRRFAFCCKAKKLQMGPDDVAELTQISPLDSVDNRGAALPGSCPPALTSGLGHWRRGSLVWLYHLSRLSGGSLCGRREGRCERAAFWSIQPIAPLEGGSSTQATRRGTDVGGDGRK